MGASLVTLGPDIQVDLRHLDWVRGRTVEIKTFIMLVPVALLCEGHMAPVLGFEPDPVPTGWELDVDLQL